MKKILTLLLCLVMVASTLTGCRRGNVSDDPNGNVGSSSAATTPGASNATSPSTRPGTEPTNDTRETVIPSTPGEADTENGSENANGEAGSANGSDNAEDTGGTGDTLEPRTGGRGMNGANGHIGTHRPNSIG